MRLDLRRHELLRLAIVLGLSRETRAPLPPGLLQPPGRALKAVLQLTWFGFGVRVGVRVAVRVGVRVGVRVAVRVAVRVGVRRGVRVGVRGGVRVGVRVRVADYP